MAIEGKKFSEFPDALQGEVVVVGLQNGQNVKVVLNTQAVTTTPEVIYRDAQGRFKSKVNLPHLANSLDNFRFIADVLDDHEARIEDQNGTIGRLEDLILEYYKKVSNELPAMDGGVIEYDDTELRKLIEDEEVYRKQGDREINDRIDRLILQSPDTPYDDTEVRQLIADEESARTSADQALNDLLVAEAEEREEADKAIIDMIEGYNPDVSDINAKLEKETKERIAGDDALGELISNNAKEIESNSTALEGHSKQLKDLWFANSEQKDQIADLDGRVTDLENQAPPESGPGYDDTELQAALAQEVEDRIEGDKTLQDQIDDIRTELEVIEELVEHHAYEIVGTTPGPGQAKFGNPGGTYWAQGTLYLGPEDMLGNATTLPYEAGDVLRFEEPDAYDYAQVTVSAVDVPGRRIDFVVNNASGSPDAGNHIRIVITGDLAKLGIFDTQAAPPVLHLMGKGQWGRSETDVATDKFIGVKTDGTIYNTLNQYVFGVMVAQSYAGVTTRELTWQQGAYLEIFDSTGLCIFATQIDSSELSSRNYLYLKWRNQPKFYVNKTVSYGTSLMLKIHGLTTA